MKVQVKTGLENFIESPPEWIKRLRIGLLCNPASVNRDMVHAKTCINERFPGRLTALFSPQHGFFAEKQDNMIQSGHMADPDLNIPVFSLYSETRSPARDMFDLIDVLIVDLQDVGTRVYTFISTMAFCMEAARESCKTVVVLDRPNPVNGVKIEGNLLSTNYRSFVGLYPIPMRHGLTIGELAILFNTRFEIGCDLVVIPMQNWKREMYFEDTGLPWVAPSPNMPTPETALVYPGQVLWEGTNVSEGRGSTLPFRIFGAPYIDSRKILADLPEHALSGIVLRPCVFLPWHNKWEGEPCNGFQIHVMNKDAYCSYDTSVAIMQAVRRNHPDAFKWKLPPYEYEYKKLPIDVISGGQTVRRRVDGADQNGYKLRLNSTELKDYSSLCQSVYLYL